MIWIVRVLLICAGLGLALTALARQSIPHGDPNEKLTCLFVLIALACFVLFVVSFFVRII